MTLTLPAKTAPPARIYRQVISVNLSLQPTLDRYAPGWSRW